MKKFEKLIALLLGVGMVVGGAALSACANDNEGNTNIDEEKWNNAFEEFDYSNYSLKAIKKIDGEDYESIYMFSENAIYNKGYIFEYGFGENSQKQLDNIIYSECFCVKNDDGTYTNYIKWCDLSELDNAKFYIYDDTSEDIFVGLKEEAAFEISYKDHYKKFTDNKDSTYYCADEIIISQHDYEEIPDKGIRDETFYMYCTDNIVTILNNKLYSFKCKVNKTKGECNCTLLNDFLHLSTEETQVDMAMECYDIGTTTVTVPQEVIDEATQNNQNNDNQE